MKSTKITAAYILIALAALTVMASSSSALVALPDPNDKYYLDSEGKDIYVAWAHDDFWSYSGLLLEATGFDFVVTGSGTGNLDLLVYSNGQVNDLFEDSVNNNVHDPFFKGWWGQNDQNNDGIKELTIGPEVTTGNLMDYLGSTVPVFYLDLNQTGANTDLYFTGNFKIKEPGGAEHLFAFDSSPQGGSGEPTYYEPGTRNDPGSIDVDFPGFGAPGDHNPGAYSVAISEIYDGYDANLGSGKYDYIVYSPLVDLSDYDRESLFIVEFHLGIEGLTQVGNKWYDAQGNEVSGDTYGALNAGFEEIFLTGLYQPPPPPVPEPNTLILLGVGLLGLAGAARKTKKMA
jgi:hypothetical protein